VLLAASAVQAQITTSRVNVLVTGKRCGELKNVFLVIDGEDLEERWIRLEPAGTCRWTADLGEETLSTKLSYFSLRFDDFARSDCHRAAGSAEKLVAELEFACCAESPLRNLRVKTDAPIPVSYVRDVRPSPTTRVGGIRCTEYGSFSAGGGAIAHTQFSGEDVFLQLGSQEPSKGSGLLLDDIVPDDGVLELSRDGVVYRLAVQRAQGKVRTPPTLSSNAISIDSKKLSALKLERAQIEVLK
jgi:hypothetical protein